MVSLTSRPTSGSIPSDGSSVDAELAGISCGLVRGNPAGSPPGSNLEPQPVRIKSVQNVHILAPGNSRGILGGSMATATEFVAVRQHAGDSGRLERSLPSRIRPSDGNPPHYGAPLAPLVPTRQVVRPQVTSIRGGNAYPLGDAWRV